MTHLRYLSFIVRTLVTGVSLCMVYTASAQESFRIEQHFTWQSPVKEYVSDNMYKVMLRLEEGMANPQNGLLPEWYAQWPSADGSVTVTLVEADWQVMDQLDEVDLSRLTDQPQLTSGIAYIKKQPFSWVTVVPLRRNALTGLVEGMTRGVFDIQVAPTLRTRLQARGSQSFASQSLLAGGNWYKVYTTEDGIHRMDASFLQGLGINVSQIDPRNIRLFSYGGGMLPESNATPRPDDLAEIPVVVSGEGDGRFDAGDAVLFYGQSPNARVADTVTVNGQPTVIFRRQPHHYDTRTCYFLTVDKGAGKRVATAANTGTPTYSTDAFDYYAHYEQELVNVAESGREWYGEKFDFAQLQRSYDFSIPSPIAGEPLYVTYNLIGRSISGAPGFNIRLNGQQLASGVVSSVGINYFDTFARIFSGTTRVSTAPANAQVQVAFSPSSGDPQSAGWLNYLTLNTRSRLALTGDQLHFRDVRSVAPAAVTSFSIAGNVAEVWDVTDVHDIQRMPLQNARFTAPTDDLREFVAFSGNSYLTPQAGGTVPNQDLHGTLGQPDVVILTASAFLSAASRLADFHRTAHGYEVAVVDVEQVYNEFSGGTKDITAIRDMMRMLYERAAGPQELPQYLVLLGDGSYDYKNLQIDESRNHNFVPTYQSYESLERSVTFVSDDYFGFLDPSEGRDINFGNPRLDIGVGRIVAEDLEQANDVVSKIIHYHSAPSLGSWRNTITFIADDEDFNTHINDADLIARGVSENHPVYNVQKIYMDAFEQIATPNGARYPQVNEAINAAIFSGALIVNYTGHGGEAGWAHEKILGIEDMVNWTNRDKLPLFVTATCSFSRFDNPNLRSGGEVLQTTPNGGAIGLVTTVRLVYSNQNLILNKALFDTLLSPVNGQFQTLGDVLMHAKNSISGGANNRKFLLLGDPAMRLGYPQQEVVTTRFQSEPFVQNGDTLRALEKVTIEGVVTQRGGGILTDFNGVVYPTIFDKSEDIQTLVNDPRSRKREFTVQKNIVYKGKASVTGGAFSFTFIVPKDISYQYGPGKISYYAENGVFDANGFDTVVVGGSADTFAIDDQGPQVQLFMNDEQFVFGGTTDENPILLVKLADDSGINTAGSAIGHDITAVMNEEVTNKIVLNGFYEAALDDFTRGEVQYPLSSLPPGRHRIAVKAWDVHNNSGEGFTEFVVAESAELALSHVLNYPNPFTTNTSFWFEHNRPGQPLQVTIQIYTVTGRVVKTIRQEVISSGFRVDDISWDGLDEYGDPIGKGVYVYKMQVVAADGAKADVFEKLVVLR